MRLLEYEGKGILSKHGIAVPKYRLSTIQTKVLNNEVFPVVLKSQVPTGGRGKAGGIIIATNQSEFDQTLTKLFTLQIKSYIPKTVLVEEYLDFKSEYYISLIIDKKSSSIQLVAHKNGGVDVEQNMHDSFMRMPINIHNIDEVSIALAEHLDQNNNARSLHNLVTNLYNCFIQNDATLLEINPMVLTSNNEFIAGDCKIELDDSAAFRHPEWNFEQGTYNNNFVTLDVDGTIATIANGAGLAMATVDAVADSGLAPANFLDIGGGANSIVVLEAFRKIMQYRNIKAIIINIFAGITHCDEVATAIIAAKQQIDGLPPLFIRLAGTNYEQAKKLLNAENIPILTTLQDCIVSAKNEVNND